MTLLEAAKLALEVLGDGFFVCDDDGSVGECPECHSWGFDHFGKIKGHALGCRVGAAVKALSDAVAFEEAFGPRKLVVRDLPLDLMGGKIVSGSPSIIVTTHPNGSVVIEAKLAKCP